MESDVPLSIQSVPIGTDAAGLALAARAWPEMERRGQLAALANLVQSGQAQQMVLLVARRGERLCGAVLAQLLAGRTAVVWPPQLGDGSPASCGNALLGELDRLLRAAGNYFAQAVLKRDSSGMDQLLAAGFVTGGELAYMAADAATFPHDAPPLPFRLVPSCELPQEQLDKVVLQTYRGSLDCPLVDGLRPIADVLAGYRAVGTHRREWWLVAFETAPEGADRAIGCVLLADHPGDEQLEIVYLGVVPECRGRGIGYALTRQAQWIASLAERERVVLAVDAANRPAISAYETAGFIAWDRRTVLIRDFRRAAKT